MPTFHLKLVTRLFFILCFATVAIGQTSAPNKPPKAPPAIQDNSFLMEEAYNQEAGVVQHINAFMKSLRGKGWIYTFTQEWPVFGQKHQFSYTVPMQRVQGIPRNLS